MYVPPRFAQNDREECLALIEREPFGLLVTVEGEAPFATHLPFLVERREDEVVLLSHMARANPQWRFFRDGGEALAIFQGPHGYISPAWYATPNRVPTWNYIAVHAYGVPRILDAPGAAHTALAALTHHFESRRDAPWTMAALDEREAEKLVAALVVFELPVVRLDGKWKLGQHMAEADRLGAVAGIGREGGDPALAAAMKP
ncbi:MAG: FMN-binding negative transcriptional regulator [Parvibaculum sp.]|nr:FMN-binding negative transcriptional regulator [Parvibaculum sp.]